MVTIVPYSDIILLALISLRSGKLSYLMDELYSEVRLRFNVHTGSQAVTSK
jgi:hypothetical protein